MAETRKRYYIHGDLTEDQPDTYYCSSCDLFCSETHFSSECRCKDHHAKYAYTLKGLKEVLKNSPEYTRPEKSFNIFA